TSTTTCASVPSSAPPPTPGPAIRYSPRRWRIGRRPAPRRAGPHGASRNRRCACRARPSEPVPGFPERVALGVGKDLGRGHGEHHRVTVAVGSVKGAIACGPLPPPIPLCPERRGDATQYLIVGDVDRLALHHDIEAVVPPVAA